MTPTRLLACALVLAWLAPAGARADDKTDPAFKAGVAERDITPEIGSEAPGGYGKAYHRSIHDPCKVRAAVFDDGASVAAIVGIDAIGIDRRTVVNIRKAISAKTKIPESAVLINCSHSHSAGPLHGTWPGDFDHADKLVQDLAYKQSTAADPKYVARVEKAAAEAVVAAYAGRVAAKAGVGKGVEKTVAFNRRFKMREGYTVTHPGQGNPSILEPAGPTDPEVGVVGVWDDKDKFLGCVVNFSCHATTSSGGVSASYIHYVEKVIKGYYGKDAVLVFVAGNSGDVTQVNNQSPIRHPAPDRWSQFVGGKVGAEALKVLLSMEPGKLTPVAHATKTLTIKRRVPSAEKVKAAFETVKKGEKAVGHTDWIFAKETVMLDAILKKHPAVEAEVQAVQVGPAVFLATPAEYFCRYGIEMKARSGFPYTFPSSLSNGCIGYVPTLDALGAGGGGYETRLTSYTNLVPTAGDTLRDTAVELAKTLKPGGVPEAPKPLPFSGKAWGYGDVKPELR